jgi:hypothetical protein
VVNERLRDSLLRKGLNPDQAANALGVDPKTIERWITKGRVPYPKHRHALAALLRESETYLWPDALQPERAAQVAESEVVAIYPHRAGIGREVWTRLWAGDQTTGQTNTGGGDVDVLIYAGLFLTEDRALLPNLTRRACDGATIRLLLGDPKAREVNKRSTEEGIGSSTIAAKIRNTLAFLAPLREVEGVQIRFHRTTLYNSIYRSGDEMLVNTHVYGSMAAHAPVLHLRRLSAGDLFETYAESFDLVWTQSKPATW